MFPLGMITGVNFNCTPNSLNEIVTAVKPAPGLNDGEGKFSASQKTGFLAVHRDQVWLGQDLQQVLLLQSFDHRTDGNVGAGDKKIEKVGNVYCRGVAVVVVVVLVPVVVVVWAVLCT